MVTHKNEARTKNETRKEARGIVDSEYEVITIEENEVSRQVDKKEKAKKIKNNCIDNGNCNKKSKGKQMKQR
jgi:hypothetical protein